MRWHPTAALVRAALIGGLLAVLAAAIGRPDALVLGAPFLVTAAWSVARRPRRSPEVRTRLAHHTMREGEATTWRTEITGGHIDRVAVSLGSGRAWTTQPDTGIVVVPGAARDEDTTTSATIVVEARRWGRHLLSPGAVCAESTWGAYRWGPEQLDTPTITTLPLPAVFDNTAPLPNPVGLVGTHRSRRIGDGAEFAAIRPFHVGDRLRRIHWPVSLRTGELHVSASHVDVDSQVMLVIDATDDVGERGPHDGPASSLDRSVRAAGAIAEHFLRNGDRVGLRTVGSSRFVRLHATSGRAHLRRILYELAIVSTGSGRERRAAPKQLGIASGSLVVVLTPLLSVAAVEQVVALARRHRSVVVVDTLPDDIVGQTAHEPSLALGWRMRLLEREADIRRLGVEGVPVVPWRGPGSLDTVLRDLNRQAVAPRVASR